MNRRYLTAATMLIATLLAGVPATAADWWKESAASTALDHRVVDRDAHDAFRIHWVDEYIEVMAGATVDERRSVNRAHATSMAKKTARHLAYEKLAETIAGIRITADATYDRELMLDANVRTKVQALVRGAVVVREDVSTYPDGSVWAEVVLGVHLKGDRGLGGPLSRWVLPRERTETYYEAPGPAPAPAPKPVPAVDSKPIPPAAPAPENPPPTGGDPEPATGEAADEPANAIPPAPRREAAPTTTPDFREKFSGVIIDGRGLGAQPAVYPRLVTESGSIVYGAGLMDEETLARRGVVAYAADLDAARELDRAGKKPLVVRASDVRGENAADLVVTDDAAALIHATVKDKKLLRRGAVVFVLD